MTRLLLLSALALVALTGCQSGTTPPAVVGLQSDTTGKSFTQNFPQAYFSVTPEGDRDVVLIDEGIPKNITAQHGTIQPVSTIPLRQVMHFKILWDPPHGTQADAPSTTNAIIDWTIRTTDRSGNSDTLRYQGAGFVLTDSSRSEMYLRVRSASLESGQHTGNLIDPIGKCSMSGSFTAYRNDDLVTATIADMREEPVAAIPASTTEGGPPLRMPSP